MGCGCEKKPKTCGMTPEVVEIVNEECPVLFHKTTISADRGDDSPESPVAPENGMYKNTLVEYEANGHAYLYSSDGIFTRINAESDFNKLINRPKYAGELMTGDTDIPSVEAETEARIAGDEALADAIAEEASERRDGDNTLRELIGTKQNTLIAGENIAIDGDTISAKDTTYTAGQNIQISADNVISAEAASYTAGTGIDITNATISVDNTVATKSDINDATLTIKRNHTDVATFTANSSTDQIADIAVPVKTSDLTNDGADGASTYVEAKDMPSIDSAFSDSSENAVQNKVITGALDRAVMTDLTLGPNPSTTVVQLDAAKTNLRSGSSTTTSIPLP